MCSFSFVFNYVLTVFSTVKYLLAFKMNRPGHVFTTFKSSGKKEAVSLKLRGKGLLFGPQ